jgi:signal transduction histidine kinase
MTLDGAEMFELANDGRASKAEAQRLNDPAYFASMAPPGVRRFVDMLEESAIWTTNLAGFAARETWIVFGLSLAVTLIALFSGVVFTDATRWQQVARVFFAMLVVLLSADFLGAAIGYDRARQEARRIVDRLQRHKVAGAALEGVMVIFADYNSAVEAMPLFSSGLYPRHEKRLNEEYKMFLTGPK